MGSRKKAEAIQIETGNRWQNFFAKRWYLVAFSEQAGELRTYALDRITALERTGGHFRMPRGFDVDALFASSYGIYLPQKGQKPVLGPPVPPKRFHQNGTQKKPDRQPR